MPTNVQNVASEVSGKAIVPVVQTTAQVGVVNNFNLNRGFTILRSTATSLLLEITGFQVNGATPQDGDRVIVEAVGGGPVRVAHEDIGSTVTNRVVTPSVRGQIIGLNGSATYVYDLASSRWHLVSVEPGRAINVPFAAGNFTAGGSMTWTVDLADQITFAYQQRGSLVTVMLVVQNTDVGGTAHPDLRVTHPNSFTATRVVTQTNVRARNAGTFSSGELVVGAVSTATVFRHAPGGTTNWTLTTGDNTEVSAVWGMEID